MLTAILIVRIVSVPDTVEHALTQQLQWLGCGGLAVAGLRMEQPGGGRVVKPRSDRYCLSEHEQAGYSAFVEMLSQLDKGARLQLAEAAVKEAAQLRQPKAAAAAGQTKAPQ